MSTTTLIPIKVRSFTGGKVLALALDPHTKISAVKEAVAESPLCKGKAASALEFNGIELSDDRTLSYYGVKENSVLHIPPPSKTPKLTLRFERSDGTPFVLAVAPTTTIAQLFRHISIEEKLDVHKLQYQPDSKDDDDSELVVVPARQDMLFPTSSGTIADYPELVSTTSGTLFVCGPPPPQTPPTTFPVCVLLHDEQRKMTVDARLTQTLHEFREAVFAQHGVSIAEDVLIMVDREVIGEDTMIWDLGFGPDCVVHAVPYIWFTVEIIDIKQFEPMLLHPLTKLSEIRKMLTEDPDVAEEDVSFYGFTIDGAERLKEWRTLWSLNLVSGSTLYLRLFGVISLMIKHRVLGDAIEFEAEEDETVFELKRRFVLLTKGIELEMNEGICEPPATLRYRNKILLDDKTLKQEGLVGGELLMLNS